MFIRHDSKMDVAVLSCWTGEWDIVGEIHDPIACTVSSREEAYSILNEYCKNNPEYTFLVFDTPGGVRAFCVSHKMNPSDWESFRLHSKLNCDPLFQEFTWKSKMYTARITPKSIRVKKTGNDYISRKRYIIGSGQILPDMVKEVKEYYTHVEKNRI
jgi:hypothetical protein